MAERDYEAEATAQGWNPDKNSVPEGKEWVDAKTFVEKGENILPIVRKRLKDVEQNLARVTESNRKLHEWSKQSIEREQSKNKDLIAQLEKERETAINDGDGQAFTRANREIERIQQQDPDPGPDEWKVAADQWVSDNPWYASDQELKIYADGVSDIIRGEGYTGPAYFKELTRRVKEAHPDKFENKQRKRPSNVDAGGDREGSEVKPKTYEALPADAKKACDEFVRDIPNFTREDYLATYEWEQANA